MVTRKQATTISINNCAAAKRLIRLAGNADTVETAIQVIAERLLEDVQCPPTNLEALFPKVNVTHCYGEDIWGSGELRREGKHFAIVYNSSHPQTRRRFSIGHEVGHALIESTGPNCPRKGENVERICDMIATELLMPKLKFSPYLNSEVSVETVTRLAQTFQTSIMTTSIRCTELTKVSVFMVNDAKILWSFGSVKKPYIIATTKDHIDRAMQGESGNDVITITDRMSRREWQLDWIPLGQNKQALFLAKPVIRNRNVSSY